MRFLIVASILACAAANPGLLAPYSAAIAPAVPTISAGDINGAVIEAHVHAADAQVVASDHVRAAYDAGRQVNDKVNELHGQAVNNAEENAWRAVDNVKTVEARLDGAAAAAAPVLSKQLVGRVAYGAPAAAYSGAPAVAYSGAPAVAYAGAPAVAYAGAPAVAYSGAPAVAYSGTPAVAYAGAPGVAYSGAPAVAYSGAPAVASYAPALAAPYSAYPNVVSPYYGSPLGYQAY